MRLPVEPLPPIEPAEDPYAIRRGTPIGPVPRMTPRSFPALVVPHPERQDAEEVLPPESDAYSTQGHRGHTVTPDSAHETHTEQTRAEERRLYCRRITQLPIILDTRSSEDRRHQVRREDVPRTVIDEEV